MPRGLSVYLDSVRFGAALVVLLSHAWEAFVPSHPLPWPGHHAVIVFFVLSGFVVAHVASTKEKTLSSFALYRSVRILTVTVPALLISLAVALFMGVHWLAASEHVAINFLFLGQSWSLDIMPDANQPFWSLCYEVWYYCIFAGALFPRSVALKAAWISGLCLLAGPKILLLMPCWLCGVFLYWNREKLRLTQTGALVMFFGSVAIYLLFYWFNVSVHIREFLKAVFPHFIAEITSSNQFAGDFLLSLVVSGNFLSVYSMNDKVLNWASRHSKFIGACAGYTLSLYLFHQPVIDFLRQVGIVSWLGIVPAVAIPALLAPLTEHRRFAVRSALQAFIRGNSALWRRS